MSSDTFNIRFFSSEIIEYESLYIFMLNTLPSKVLYIIDSMFLDILNDPGTNSNDKLFVAIHKTFNLCFKISFIVLGIPQVIPVVLKSF